MVNPKVTPISPALHRKLMEADAAVKAVQQMMQLFQQSAQSRLQTAHDAARVAWHEIMKETGIDLKNVSWEPHPTDPAVVPTAIRLDPDAG